MAQERIYSSLCYCFWLAGDDISCAVMVLTLDRCRLCVILTCGQPHSTGHGKLYQKTGACFCCRMTCSFPVWTKLNSQ
uniref:Uncharacterized protein n=1 Tax=Anguilla anguilla TaxID=7936 RepID=A0A0E9WNK4_ANGAN